MKGPTTATNSWQPISTPEGARLVRHHVLPGGKIANAQASIPFAKFMPESQFGVTLPDQTDSQDSPLPRYTVTNQTGNQTDNQQLAKWYKAYATAVNTGSPQGVNNIKQHVLMQEGLSNNPYAKMTAADQSALYYTIQVNATSTLKALQYIQELASNTVEPASTDTEDLFTDCNKEKVATMRARQKEFLGILLDRILKPEEPCILKINGLEKLQKQIEKQMLDVYKEGDPPNQEAFDLSKWDTRFRLQAEMVCEWWKHSQHLVASVTEHPPSVVSGTPSSPLENKYQQALEKAQAAVKNQPTSEQSDVLDRNIRRFKALSISTVETIDANSFNGFTLSSGVKKIQGIRRNCHLVTMQDAAGTEIFRVRRTANIGASGNVGLNTWLIGARGLLNTIYGITIGNTSRQGINSAKAILENEIADIRTERPEEKRSDPIKLYVFDVTGTVSNDDEWQMGKNTAKAIAELKTEKDIAERQGREGRLKQGEEITLIHSNVKPGQDFMGQHDVFSRELFADAQSVLNELEKPPSDNELEKPPSDKDKINHIEKAYAYAIKAVEDYNNAPQPANKTLVMAAQINLAQAIGGDVITMCKSGKDRNSVLNWLAMAMRIHMDQRPEASSKLSPQWQEEIADIMCAPDLLDSVLQTTKSVARMLIGTKKPFTVIPTQIAKRITENHNTIKERLDHGSKEAKGSKAKKSFGRKVKDALWKLIEIPFSVIPFVLVIVPALLVSPVYILPKMAVSSPQKNPPDLREGQVTTAAGRLIAKSSSAFGSSASPSAPMQAPATDNLLTQHDHRRPRQQQ